MRPCTVPTAPQARHAHRRSTLSARRATHPPRSGPHPDAAVSTAQRPRQPHCPLPPVMSPYADATQDWLGDWLRAVWPQADDDIRQRMERVGFARYAARLYPDAEPAVLRTLSGLFTWFFLLDDTADTSSAPDPAWLRGLVNGSLAVLRHGPTASQRPEGLHRLLAEAWRNPHAVMPQSWRHRFIDAVQHHLDGVLLEAEAKSLGRRPTVEGYIQLRRATSAGYVAHVLTEYAVRAPLPDSVHGHPAVRAVQHRRQRPALLVQRPALAGPGRRDGRRAQPGACARRGTTPLHRRSDRGRGDPLAAPDGRIGGTAGGRTAVSGRRWTSRSGTTWTAWTAPYAARSTGPWRPRATNSRPWWPHI